MGDPLEVEVKFYVGDVTAVRQHLSAQAATQKKPRLYERNVLYDTAEGQLQNGQQLLRLRQDERARLTFKGPAPLAVQAQSEAKVREELEIGVSDFALAEQILGRLGFQPRRVYEKYRETWQLGGIEIVLDELPFGHFIELEGVESEMKPLATALGLAWSQRILVNYLGLMAHVKSHHQLDFEDLTFANFADVTVDPQLWAAVAAG